MPGSTSAAADMIATAEILDICGGIDALDPGATISLARPFPAVLTPTAGAAMSLIIRRSPDAPSGRLVLVVGHYQEIDGQSQPDPEIRFEVDASDWRSGRWNATGMTTVTGHVLDADDAARFATDWDRTIAQLWLPVARGQSR